MIARALSEGVRSATRRPGLVTLLWAWNLVLALLAALPFLGWVSTATRTAPATDVLLDGLDVGLVTQLLRSDAAVVPALFLAFFGLVAVSLLSGAFLSGGVLQVVLNEGDGRGLLPRFFEAAGAYFWRFVRLLLLGGVTTVVVVGPLGAGLAAGLGAYTAGGTEAGAFAGRLAVQAVVLLALSYFLVSLDYARAMTVVTGNRGMTRTWLRAMAFVLRHLLPVAVIGLLAALLGAAAVGGAIAYDASHSARTWGVIVLSLVLQQALAWIRTAVRVGQVSAQATYCEGWLPLPAAAPVAGEPRVTQNGSAAMTESPQIGPASEIVVDNTTREG